MTIPKILIADDEVNLPRLLAAQLAPITPVDTTAAEAAGPLSPVDARCPTPAAG